MSIKNAEFNEWLTTEGRASETVYNYGRDIAIFAGFLEKRGVGFAQITKVTIPQFVEYLRAGEQGGKPWADRSINRMSSSLRTYFEFLTASGEEIPIDPKDITRLKVVVLSDRSKLSLLSLPEIFSLLRLPTEIERDERVGLRNKAMMELMFAATLKIGQVIGLDREQIDLGSGKLSGNKRWQAPIGVTDRAVDHLERYLSTRRDHFPAMFIPTRGGRNGEVGERLSYNHYSLTLGRYANMIGLGYRVVLKTLSFGMYRYAERVGDFKQILPLLLREDLVLKAPQVYRIVNIDGI